MNYRTIILAFLVCTLTCNAQLPSCSQILTKGNVVDTARFVITYDMRFTSIENDTLHSDDRKVLVGDRMSVDYSQTTYYYDSIGTDMYVHGAEDVPMCQDFVFPYEIFNHYTDKTNRIYYRMFMDTGILRYDEEIQPQEWKPVPNEHKIIMGHTCNKATTVYKGRSYVAWYTLDIPIPLGPFKFQGLPGLILAISDSEGKYAWRATGLERTKRPIVEYRYSNVIPCSRKKARATISKMFKAPFAHINSMGQQVFIMGTDGGVRQASPQYDEHSMNVFFLEKE